MLRCNLSRIEVGQSSLRLDMWFICAIDITILRLLLLLFLSSDFLSQNLLLSSRSGFKLADWLLLCFSLYSSSVDHDSILEGLLWLLKSLSVFYLVCLVLNLLLYKWLNFTVAPFVALYFFEDAFFDSLLINWFLLSVWLLSKDCGGRVFIVGTG